MRFLIPAAWLFAAALCLSAEPGAPGLILNAPDPFAFGSWRPPRPGEWLEYRVAFPLDPLEESLGKSRSNVGAEGTEPERETDGAQPAPGWLSAFDLPRIWRTLPLRLEVLEINDKICRARLTFAGAAREVELPLAEPDEGDRFVYPFPQPPDARLAHRLWDRVLEADQVSRLGSGGGFVRLTHPEAPFGLLRLASPDLDLILVGFGDGVPPAFPLSLGVQPDPPPGRLYPGE